MTSHSFFSRHCEHRCYKSLVQSKLHRRTVSFRVFIFFYESINLVWVLSFPLILFF